MKRLYVYGWDSESQGEAITQFGSSKEINLVRWISEYGVERKMEWRNLHYRPFTLNESSAIIDDQTYARIYKHFPIAIDMYSRVAYTRGFPPQEFTNILNMYVRYFYADLKLTKPDIVLFGNIPHFGIDYILYLCAVELKIETRIVFQTLFPNRFFSVSSFEELNKLDNSDHNSKNAIVVKKSFKKDLFYMKKAKQKYGFCYTKMLADFVRKSFYRRQPLTFSGIIVKFSECRIFTKLYPNAIKNDIDLSINYIYFPLQLQPELTTSALGGIYVDQLLALEQLSAILPDNWKIYVKENPKQTPKQRREFFFKRLKAIPNIEYLSSRINTHKLIEHSQLVAVVTGTAGWEAISGGIPVIIFGQAWYSSLPGVYKYSDNIDIKKISSRNIDHSNLEVKLNQLLDNAYEGVVDLEYNEIVKNYSDSKNVEYILTYLRKLAI